MNRFHAIAFSTLALVAVACAPQEADSGDDSQSGAQSASAAEETLTVGNITLTTKHVSAKVKAKEAADEFNPDFDSCETNVDYLTIKGTEHDAEINKLLRGDWTVPTAATCETAETYEASVQLKLIDPEQGILSLVEPESYYSGGAHPSHGLEFKNIDLRTGKLLTFADYVKADSAAKLQQIVEGKIANQLTRVYYDAPKFDGNGKKRTYETKKLDADAVDMMKQFAGYFFQTWDGDKQRPARADEMKDFSLAGTGLRIDLANNLPHAMGGAEASYKLLWSELETAGVLRTDTDLVARTKAARARQRR